MPSSASKRKIRVVNTDFMACPKSAFIFNVFARDGKIKSTSFFSPQNLATAEILIITHPDGSRLSLKFKEPLHTWTQARIKYLSSGSSGREHERTKDKLKALNLHLSQLFSQNIHAKVKSNFPAKLQGFERVLSLRVSQSDPSGPDVRFTAFQLLLRSQNYLQELENKSLQSKHLQTSSSSSSSSCLSGIRLAPPPPLPV